MVKKLLIIFECIIVLTVILAGCDLKSKKAEITPAKEKQESNANADANVDENVDENVQPEETDVDALDGPEVVVEGKNHKDVLSKLINAHGRYPAVAYCELVDFEKDEEPELVVLRRNPNFGEQEVVVYRYDGEKSVKMYEQKLGERFGQSDYSPSFAINSGSFSCLVTFHTENSWMIERMKVFTIENGEGKETVLFAETSVPLGEEGYDTRDPFYYFEINEEPVNKDEFYSWYNKVCDGITEIDVEGGEGPGNYDSEYEKIPVKEERLNEFLQQFGL